MGERIARLAGGLGAARDGADPGEPQAAGTGAHPLGRRQHRAREPAPDVSVGDLRAGAAPPRLRAPASSSCASRRQVRTGRCRCSPAATSRRSSIAKWLNADARVFIFDEPTRGIDVGAKAEIFRLIDQLVQKGAAVLMISSEQTEIVHVCDRAYVMREGRIVGELARDRADRSQHRAAGDAPVSARAASRRGSLARAHARRRDRARAADRGVRPGESELRHAVEPAEHPDAVDHPAAAGAADDAHHHDRRARPLDGRGADARLDRARHDGHRHRIDRARACGGARGRPRLRPAQRCARRAARHPALRRDARHARHRAGTVARRHRRAERRRHSARTAAGLWRDVRRRADPDLHRHRGLRGDPSAALSHALRHLHLRARRQPRGAEARRRVRPRRC